jgi:ribosomal protein S18 acetylase RimI-like enzyme
MDIHVRPATPGDYDDLCTVLDEVDDLHRDSLPYIFQKPGGPVREREYLLKLMTGDDTGLLVAEVEGRVAGTLQVAMWNTPPVPLLVPRRLAIVDSLAVKSEFRRAGIGRALMDAAHRWAAARGATSVELSVYAFNQAAIGFYQALGYDMLSHRMAHEL